MSPTRFPAKRNFTRASVCLIRYNVPAMADPLLATLKRTFGYESFRPLQEAIIRDALAGRDVFALLPTGGGKSICFQIPALLLDGLTVVVSPLIALMKDQVDALRANGVAATFLNSTLTAGEARSRLAALHAGKIRLLYAAPERLMLPGFLSDLRKWNVRLIAIDEAHCISEWGHDFRPEYRALSQLRAEFPDVPMMALTATATDRVRDDIVTHLNLRDPARYVASFNRPNLQYHVMPKSGGADQITSWIQQRPSESGIVYCASRRGTESLAETLRTAGLRAEPYHAGLDADTRAGTQEKFVRDQINIVCATIAFGMGIDKSNVRFVLHADLPKNLEGYYQETGRAGRDGLPSECVLFFSGGDAVKQRRFIDEKTDPAERAIALRQLQQMIDYAESPACRRAALLRYFGETWPDDNCAGCDNCIAPRATFDATVAARKFLSCLHRIREKSGFSSGLRHVIDVLIGAETDKVKRWGHDTISTFGIGREHTPEEWESIGRQLLGRGFAAEATKFRTIELAPEGRTFLRENRSIELARPMARAQRRERFRKTSTAGQIACDESLFDRLRQLRRRIADERAVPAYVIFSDATLRAMAAAKPRTKEDFSKISGVGAQKLAEFADPFLQEINAHSSTAPNRSPIPHR
jgi:ATP-dependent DNA helicase RecQ